MSIRCNACGNTEKFTRTEYGKVSYWCEELVDGDENLIDSYNTDYEDYNTEGTEDYRCDNCGSHNLDFEWDNIPNWKKEYGE